MVKPIQPSSYLTLKDVCSLLGVRPRQIQYLREVDILEPAVCVTGRGNSCLYSGVDVECIYIAVFELSDFSSDAKRRILDSLPKSGKMHTLRLRDNTEIHIDLEAIRSKVAILINSLVDCSS